MSAFGQTLNPALQRLGEVCVRLSVELGRTDMALKDVLALAEGSVVSLDKLTDELLDITANGQVIAHGEVIAQDGKFALRIVSLAGGDEPLRSPPRTKPSGAPKSDMPNSAPTAPYVSSPGSPAAAPSAEPSSADPATSDQPAVEGEAKAGADPLLDTLDELTNGLGAPTTDAPTTDAPTTDTPATDTPEGDNSI